MEDIDIVIIWVDGNDLEWRKEYLKYKGEKTDNSNDESRFRDFETLKYVFRGIDKFMPWARKIHFITCGHLPNWLNINHPKINFQTHKDIFMEKKNLPVFNSQAIEMNFLGIDDLADKFIYFNDDTLILKKTESERFFKNNLPVDFLIQGIPRRGKVYKKFFTDNLYVDAINNNIGLINRFFSKKDQIERYKEKYYFKDYGRINLLKNYISNRLFNYYQFMHYHHPQSYLKKTLEEVNKNCEREIRVTTSSKFREKSDVSQYLYRYWQLVSGDFEPCFSKDFKTYHIINKEMAKKCMEDIKKYRFLCINDDIRLIGEEYKVVKNMILNALEDYFKEKSLFEL